MVRLSNYIEDYYPAPTTTPPSQDSDCDGVPDSDNDGWCDTIDPCPDIPGIRCCGDGDCASDEDCSSCPEDCGECPNSPEPPPSTPPSDPCGDDLDGDGVGENCDECPGVKGKVEYNGCRCPGVPDDYGYDDCMWWQGKYNFLKEKEQRLNKLKAHFENVSFWTKVGGIAIVVIGGLTFIGGTTAGFGIMLIGVGIEVIHFNADYVISKISDTISECKEKRFNIALEASTLCDCVLDTGD